MNLSCACVPENFLDVGGCLVWATIELDGEEVGRPVLFAGYDRDRPKNLLLRVATRDPEGHYPLRIYMAPIRSIRPTDGRLLPNRVGIGTLIVRELGGAEIALDAVLPYVVV